MLFYQTKNYWCLTQYSDFFLSYELRFVMYLNKIIIFRFKNQFFNSLPVDNKQRFVLITFN